MATAIPQITSDLQCKNATSQGKARLDVPVADFAGLALRVTKDGNKSWSLRYRRGSDGKLRRMTLGQYGDVSLKQARERAREIRNEAAEGADPAGAKHERRAADTFHGIAEQWIAFKERQGRAASYVKRSRFRLRALPKSFTERKAGEIERVHIAGVLESMAKGGATTEVNHYHAFIRGVFRWAFSDGLVERDPSAGLKPRFDTNTRERVWLPAEWLAFWHGIAAAPASEASRIAMQLVMLLGQRPKEIAHLRRDGLDLDALHPTMRINRETAKNRVEHIVPLPPRAVALLRRALEIAAHGPDGKPKSKAPIWVFPAPGDADPLDPHAFAVILHRARDDKAETLFGLADVILYDARRTIATWLGDQGHPNEFVGLLLNHLTAAKGSVTGRHYNHSRYMAQKRTMMAEWARHVDSLLGAATDTTNVHELPNTAAVK